MTVQRRSRLVDATVDRIFGRSATIDATQGIAPGVVTVTFRAEAPKGGWRPGHEIELWVDEAVVRHYTVAWVDPPECFGIVADLWSDGPGAQWLGEARPGAHTRIAAGQHRDLRLAPGRAALLGDASAIGLFRALVDHRVPDARVHVESPAVATDPLRAWWPGAEHMVQGSTPGHSLEAPLGQLLDGDDVDAYVLAGHAQTIQRLRSILRAKGVPRRAITTRAHWSTGRTGL